MRDLQPFLVLSPKAFNKRTSLVIGLPMTTAEYNESNPFAVVAGTSKAGKTSYIVCHQPKSFDWVLHSAKPHPDKKVLAPVLSQALMVLNQIVNISEA
jgi:mRNA interferase MazF